MSFILSQPTLATVNYYGAFSDYTTQTLAAGVAGAVQLGVTDFARGFSIVSNSRITTQVAGLYNLQFSLQLQNTSVSLDDVYVWLRRGGTDIDGSTGYISVPSRHAGLDGHLIVGWNWFVSLSVNQYVEIFWSTVGGSTTVKTYPATVAPVRPSTASAVVTIGMVA